jgi:hypothetical protein
MGHSLHIFLVRTSKTWDMIQQVIIYTQTTSTNQATKEDIWLNACRQIAKELM